MNIRNRRTTWRAAVCYALVAALVAAGCTSTDGDSSSFTLPPVSFTLPPAPTTSAVPQLEVVCSLVNDDGTCGQFELRYLCATCTTKLRTTIDLADEIDPNQLIVDFSRENFDDLLADMSDSRLNVIVDDFAASQLDALVPQFDNAARVLLADGIECHRLGRIPVCF